MSSGVAVWALWVWLCRPPTIPVPEASPLSFANVTVVNPGRGRTPHRQVRIVDGEIRSITAYAPGGSVSAGEGDDLGGAYSGHYLLPGLIDMHVHYPPEIAFASAPHFNLLFLMHGVTAVRDLATLDGASDSLRARVRAGQEPGPRIFTCGRMLDGEPPIQSFARVITRPEQARAALEKLTSEGADCIKVYENVAPDVLSALRVEAAAADLPLIGHVPRAVSLRDAGLAEVHHLTGSPAERLAREVLNPEMLQLRALSWRGVDERRMAEIVQISREQGLTHVPTGIAFDADAEFDYEGAAQRPEVQLLARFWRDIVWSPRYDLRFQIDDSDTRAAFRESAEKRWQLVLRLQQAGVRILAGTDTPNPFLIPGSSLQQELRAMVRAGLSPEEAWVTATGAAGEALGVPKLGSVAVGAPADLLLFREDPTRDLAALATLEAVVADGRLYSRAALAEAQQAYEEKFRNPIYDRLSVGLAAIVYSLAAPN